MAADNKSGKAPSFYSTAAEMPPGGGGGKGASAGAGAGAGGGASADAAGGAEESKIVATLLEVIDKWAQTTKDPKRKEKIQQIASIAKEIQTGMSGGDGKPMPSESAAPAPDTMGAGAGASGGAGAGAPMPPPPA